MAIACPAPTVCDFDCALRYIPTSEHEAIRNGTSTADVLPLIQPALDSWGSVYFPPGVYCGNDPVKMPAEATLRGHGTYASCLKSEGPVVQFGNGQDYSCRSNELLDICLDSNNVAPALIIDHSPDFQVFNSFIRGGIDIFDSTRGQIHDSRVIASNRWAILARWYSNAISIKNNFVTGGSAGGAINLQGPVTQGEVIGNTIESSKFGIWISSVLAAGADAGVSRNLAVKHNYIEQSEIPFAIGMEYIVRASEFLNNIVANNSASVIPVRDCAFLMRRVERSLFERNTIFPETNEDVFCVEFRTTNDFIENELRCNNVEGLVGDYLSTRGALGGNLSLLRDMGARNYIEDITDQTRITSKEDRVFYSKELSGEHLGAQVSWLKANEMNFGGSIKKVELVETQGDLSGLTLRLGTSANQSRITTAVLSNFNPVLGCIEIPLATNYIEKDLDHTYTLTGNTSACFRLKITYRAT